MQCRLLIRQNKYTMKLFSFFLLFKFALELSYAVYLSEINPFRWPLDFNPVKYMYGFLWIMVLFLGISHERKLVSTFFLQFLFAFQIIPLTVIYALTNENTIYYSAVCFSVAVSEYLVCHIHTIRSDIRLKNIHQGHVIIVGFCLLLIGFLLYIYRINGLPTLMALNIYDVYKLRSNGSYQIGKYAGYLQALLTKIVMPILLAKFLIDRRYFWMFLLIGWECVIYLYTGHKSQFFMLFLVIGTVWLAMKDNFPKRFWRLYCGGMIISSMAPIFRIPFSGVIYDLFVRRVLFVTAQLSFYYFDFFSTRPLLWMAGIFPRWLVPFPNPYEGMHYDLLIGRLYFGTETWANNGFISEGFSHFGFGGIILNLILFAIVLKLIDGLQTKAGYAFAAGCCINVIFGLGDGHLLLIFGYIGAWILFMVLYRPDPSVGGNAPIIRFGRSLPRLILGRRS